MYLSKTTKRIKGYILKRRTNSIISQSGFHRIEYDGTIQWETSRYIYAFLLNIFTINSFCDSGTGYYFCRQVFRRRRSCPLSTCESRMISSLIGSASYRGNLGESDRGGQVSSSSSSSSCVISAARTEKSENDLVAVSKRITSCRPTVLYAVSGRGSGNVCYSVGKRKVFCNEKPRCFMYGRRRDRPARRRSPSPELELYACDAAVRVLWRCPFSSPHRTDRRI